MGPEVTLTRAYHFSAAHELANPALSPEANAALYGACHRPHGHNYKLLVTVEREVDPKTGFVMDFEDLRKHVWEHALERCDHHDLNTFLENPTAENIVVWIWNELKPGLQGLKELKLYETDEYSVRYTGEA